MITCFYHKDCLDGFASAWVVKQRYPDAHFIPATYGELPPRLPTGEVLFVDFIYTDLAVMRDIIHSAKRVAVYDHHPQAKELINTLHGEFDDTRFLGVFDANRSGAGITWDTLYPNQPRPKLINYVEDRDLWRFSLAGTRDFCDGLRQLPYQFSEYSKAITKEGIDRLKASGRDYREALKRRCQETIQNNRIVLTLPVSDGPLRITGAITEYPHERSELASMLLDKTGQDMVAVVWYLDEGIRVRLVSREHGPDVNQLAKQFGGGGHPHAAGIMLRKDQEHYLSKQN